MATKAEVTPAIMTGVCRLNFPNVFFPETEGKYAKGDYNTVVFFDKDDEDTKQLMKEVLMYARKVIGPNVTLKDFQHPFNNGDTKMEKDKKKGKDFSEEKEALYTNSYYVNMRSNYKPRVVKVKGGKLVDIQAEDDEVYSGVRAKINCTPWHYSNEQEGISLRLNHILILGGGDRIASGISAEEAFASELGAVADSVPDEDDMLLDIG